MIADALRQWSAMNYDLMKTRLYCFKICLSISRVLPYIYTPHEHCNSLWKMPLWNPTSKPTTMTGDTELSFFVLLSVFVFDVVAIFFFVWSAAQVQFSKALFIWGKTPHLPDPGLTSEVNFSDCFHEIFHLTCQPRGWEARWSKVSFPWNQNELTNENQPKISFHLTIPVVFRLYGKISPHPGEIPPLVRWDFTIPVVLRSSCKRELKIQRILLEGGISPLSPVSGRWGVFPHINRP